MKKKIICWLLLMVLLVTGCSITGELNVLLEGEPEYTEVTVEDSVFESRFYFKQFSEEEQLVYKEIYQGMMDGQKEIAVHSKDGEQVNQILTAVLLDFPQIFWTDGGGSSTTYDETYTVLKPVYTYVGDVRKQRENEIEKEVAQIIGSVSSEWSEYEKIKYIYEYLVETVTYVDGAADNQNIYSALIGKQSVCAGYAKANQYLLERLGIDCIYVTGTADGQNGLQSHAWNIVTCNGNYYYVDVTWADSIWFDEENHTSEEILYDYLCCDEGVIGSTHAGDENYVFPECNSSDLNYYRLNHLYYENVNRTELLEAMYETIDVRGESTVFKFSNAQTYDKAKNLIIDELIDVASQHLGKTYKLDEVQCVYSAQDELNRFVIYWKYE